ncbi:hypothetical protein CBR_g38954 [Chara braunii]|uniref:Gamma-butyrobetaine hydroxylase-like N-terminal domain-containing protein n=1 Tax=Chara braunii TaxID=69332 RepID=A0A388K106_CHABU|nr:hypothetical protein CBR_g38954 [Chara braunii]|eukprot:GBG63643.1 hypothetical protein CBR_g38954 [Chara braunii]
MALRVAMIGSASAGRVARCRASFLIGSNYLRSLVGGSGGGAKYDVAAEGGGAGASGEGSKHWPVEIRHQKAEKAIEIEFENGKRFRYPAELLRVESPSADNQRVTASGERRVVAGRRQVSIVSLEPVGNYGLRIVFDDLHDTGIYNWNFLYELGDDKIARIRSYLHRLPGSLKVSSLMLESALHGSWQLCGFQQSGSLRERAQMMPFLFLEAKAADGIEMTSTISQQSQEDCKKCKEKGNDSEGIDEGDVLESEQLDDEEEEEGKEGQLVVRQHLLVKGEQQRVQRVCDIRKYGAVGDGLLYDTEAIQRAIDDCATYGGTVLVPSPKTFLTATLHLRSHVTLHVEQGATILGGHRLDDFPRSRDRWYVVLAENTTGVRITGRGTIDGQAHRFVIRERPEKHVMVSWNETGQCTGPECRPRLIGFLDSVDVLIRDVQLHEPAYWCVHLVRCNGARIVNVSIFGDFNIPNNDGIDVDGSNNTLIEFCRIDTGDDAICPKSTRGPVFNLTAHNCWLRSKSSAVKLGSGSEHNFHGLRFHDLTVVDSHRGLAIQLRDEGDVVDVEFKNIRMSTQYYHPSWWGRAEPIYITSVPRNKRTTKVGRIRDVRFINVTAHSENGIFISGSQGSWIDSLTFCNVSIAIDRWTDFPGGWQDYRPGDYRGLVRHKTVGLFADYVATMALRGVRIVWGNNKQPDWGQTLEITPRRVLKLGLSDVTLLDVVEEHPGNVQRGL